MFTWRATNLDPAFVEDDSTVLIASLDPWWVQLDAKVVTVNSYVTHLLYA